MPHEQCIEIQFKVRQVMEEMKWKQAPEVGDHIQLPLAAENLSRGPLVNCKASIERDPA